MEGSRRSRQPPLDVEREFAGSRLEEQILVRTYELVVPVIRHSLDVERQRTAAAENESSQRFRKGA
jgi:hypothetical protein